jgi:UDP-N-acetylglucosamine acyltransferase
VTIHRPTQAEALTAIGNDNFLMAYAHVAHNCCIENNVTIANAVALGGYSYVESNAVIGGMAGIHQRVRIGRLAMVGAMSKILRDVPPYMLIEGNPARMRGLNAVGLKRSGMGIGSHAYRDLKQAYHLLYRSTMPFAQALEQLTQKVSTESSTDPLLYLSQFLRQTQEPGRRGAISGRGQPQSVSLADD